MRLYKDTHHSFFAIFSLMTYEKALSLLSNDSITTSDQLLCVLDYIVACLEEPVSAEVFAI